jgi:UDP-N-acetylglucosamine 4,6-dehydratase/5-epimerase
MRNYLSHTPDLDGARILVTGGTGSFGRAFVRTVLARFKLSRLVVFSRDEMKQYEMQQQLAKSPGAPVRFFIGDVRDRDRLEMAMRDIDIVIHAAALKHVPAAEYNPFECIRTNVHGAENIVSAALRAGVKKVIALSTDKAANPVNLYGASKLAAEKIFVAGNSLAGSQPTRFAVVRYGNVLGSRGSVVPLFTRLLNEGADSLPITDLRMTRFWITLDQGVDFVISSLARMHGGEVFVPKIPSMRVADLARAMAPALPHRNVGIRPGEKLHEVLLTEDEARSAFEYADSFIVAPAFVYWNDLAQPKIADGGTPVPESFRYASDTNVDWLDEKALVSLLGQAT